MKVARFLFPFVMILGLVLSACSGSQGTNPAPTVPAMTTPASGAASPVVTGTADQANLPANAPVLTVLVHDSFAVTQGLIVDFEKANGVKVSFIKGGDAGSALNRAILTKSSPIADVFYGVDNTFLSRALDEGIYEPYNSPLLQQIPDTFKLDPQNRALPVDYGDVCINYDKAYFKEKNLSLPNSLEDLAQPAYKGLLVTENPATSSPGLAFLLATIAHFGPEKYLDYWKQMRNNGLVVVNDWETAYYTNFSGSSGKGPQPMVVSYGTSPAAEVIYATQKLTESPTASIVAPGTCFRQEEFVGILKGTKNQVLAEKFVDFMLSVPFQQDMPEQMFVFPVNQQAKLPESFLKYVQVPSQPVQMDPAEITKNRNAWIEAWTTAVLR
jgi:thiamine transport system substrate-binding protein